ncbi:MAG TPA: hypothetical protein VGI06_02365, partial [Acidimicrobiales bacterium]
AFARQTPVRARQLVAEAEGAVVVADGLGDPSLRALARWYWAYALKTVGEFDHARQVNDDALAIAAEATPVERWLLSSHVPSFAIASGRFDAAAEAVTELDHTGESLQQVDTAAFSASIAINAAVWRGELGDFADAMGLFADTYPAMPSWRAGHIWGLCESGRPDEARRLLADHGLEPRRLVDDVYPLLVVAQLCFVARALGDRGLARSCEEVLAPLGGLWSHYGSGVIGPVTWLRGICAEVSGDVDGAVERYREALFEAGAVGFDAVALHIRLDLAGAVLRRAGPGDAELARGLAEECRLDAERMHAPRLGARADELLTRAG